MVLNNTINVNQILVGIIDNTPDLRIVLSDSEEECSTADKRFDIGSHPVKVCRK